MITGYIIERCEEDSEKWLRCNARLCQDLSYRVNFCLPKTVVWLSCYIYLSHFKFCMFTRYQV